MGLIVKVNSEGEYPSDREALYSQANIHSLPLDQWHPNDAAIKSLLQVVHDALYGTSVLIHCTHGRDRTGLLCGAWRLLKQNWTIDRTLAEFHAFGAVGLVALADKEIVEYLKGLKP